MLERGRQEETRGLERVDSQPGPGAPFSSLNDTVITKVPAAFFLNLSPVFPFSKGGWGGGPNAFQAQRPRQGAGGWEEREVRADFQPEV